MQAKYIIAAMQAMKSIEDDILERHCADNKLWDRRRAIQDARLDLLYQSGLDRIEIPIEVTP